MGDEQEKKIEINVHNGGQLSMAFDDAHIDAQQSNGNEVSRSGLNEIDSKHTVEKFQRKRFLIIVFSVGIICLVCLVFYREKPMSDDEIYNNVLFQKAKALQMAGKYLDAAVIYNELYVSLPNAKNYQLETIKFWEAYAYSSQFILSEGAENKYRYTAIEIFENIANTKYEENEDIKLLSMGMLILLSSDLSDENYEKKITYYCKNLEEAMENYNTKNKQDYNTYNTQTIVYYALAEYYQKLVASEKNYTASFNNLKLTVSYYQNALDNCRGMMKYEHGIFDSKRIELILLKKMSIYYPLAYLIVGDEKYLLSAETCFDEIRIKVDVNTDLQMYVDCMKNVAKGKIVIGNEESLEEAYEILNTLFYHICKNEEDLCYIGYWMIRTGLGTKTDIENVKECFSQEILKLEKENNIPEYVNLVYNAADCYWFLVDHYQDRDAYNQGYDYLLHLQNAYLDLVESPVKNMILELKKKYEDYQEY